LRKSKLRGRRRLKRPLRQRAVAAKPLPNAILQVSDMSIDKETARRVAHLARIEVDESALEPLAKDLSRILDFMDELGEVDVEGVEPMTSVTPMRLKRREDVVTDGDRQDDILRNAPDAREGFFAVPKVVE
jgi:aspartyl-tRNA(Asn)/glutamyl-tRNA(Gln) amidotransferase subunit C